MDNPKRIALLIIFYIGAIVISGSGSEKSDIDLIVAQNHFQVGDFEGALKYAENACQKDPKSSSALVSKSLYLLSLGKDFDALHSSDMATQVDPGCASAWAAKSLSLYALGLNNEAGKSWEKAEIIDPFFKKFNPITNIDLSAEQNYLYSNSKTVRAQFAPLAFFGGYLVKEAAVWTGRVIVAAIISHMTVKAVDAISGESTETLDSAPIYNVTNNYYLINSSEILPAGTEYANESLPLIVNGSLPRRAVF